MKRIIKSAITTTGTEALIVNNGLGFGDYIILMNEKREPIAEFKNYPVTPAKHDYNIAGTEVEKMLNEKSYIYFIAKKMQENSGIFHYHYPLHEIVEGELNSQEKIDFNRKIVELNAKVADLQNSLYNYRTFGTDNKREIEKIKKGQEKEARKVAKKEAKELKHAIEKEARILIAKKKEGFKYIAIHRIWGGSPKHLKFNGISKDFVIEKPRTREYFELNFKTIAQAKEIAKKTIKY